MLKVIRSEIEYNSALARIETLWDAEPYTPDFDELEVLAMLVEKYEEANFPIDAPDPVEAIKFRMDQRGLKKADLKPFIGVDSKVSEVLNYKRGLSLPMIRALSDGLQIPPAILVKKYELKRIVHKQEIKAKKVEKKKGGGGDRQKQTKPAA